LFDISGGYIYNSYLLLLLNSSTRKKRFY